MTPTLKEGDRLLVRYGARPRPGAIAIVRFADGVVAVKRLDHRSSDGWWVVRDNAFEGRDSWSGGAIAEDGVLALAAAAPLATPGAAGGGARRRCVMPHIHGPYDARLCTMGERVTPHLHSESAATPQALRRVAIFTFC